METSENAAVVSIVRKMEEVDDLGQLVPDESRKLNVM